jgi:hypothetical protein
MGRGGGVRHKEFLPALGAAHPGKALLEIAAFQELAHDRADDRPPETVARLVALLVDRLKLRIKPLDQLIEGSLLGLWYSDKSRGQRAKAMPSAAAGTGLPSRPPTAREARKGRAALIKQVYELDPLRCAKCGSEMKIIAFIERHQTEVIEKILRHCGLWEESAARGPPAAPEPAII